MKTLWLNSVECRCGCHTTARRYRWALRRRSTELFDDWLRVVLDLAAETECYGCGRRVSNIHWAVAQCDVAVNPHRPHGLAVFGFDNHGVMFRDDFSLIRRYLEGTYS